MENKIIYKEQIKDNFYYAEYYGLRVIIDKNSEYFNATKLCFFAFKKYKTWRENNITRFLFDLIEKYTMEEQELHIDIPSQPAISGIYLNIFFIKFIYEWMNAEPDMSGYVYIITNKEFENNNLFMIGYAKNFVRKMSELNKNMKFFTKFHTVILYESFNAKLLETKIHTQLKEYKTSDGCFMCDLNTIKEKFANETCIKIYTV